MTETLETWLQTLEKKFWGLVQRGSQFPELWVKGQEVPAAAQVLFVFC